MDVAAWVQAVTEEIVLRLTRSLVAETGERNLCLARGVATYSNDGKRGGDASDGERPEETHLPCCVWR
jgi:hypothetical protein